MGIRVGVGLTMDFRVRVKVGVKKRVKVKIKRSSGVLKLRSKMFLRFYFRRLLIERL